MAPTLGQHLEALPEGLVHLLATRELYTKMNWKGYSAFEDGTFDGESTTDLGAAELASSKRLGSGDHAIMVDIDWPARLVEEPFGVYLEALIEEVDVFDLANPFAMRRRWVRAPLPFVHTGKPGHWLIPSSTEGHSHLYVDVQWDIRQIIHLLDQWVEIGLVEAGYRDASAHRGATALRLPWIAKGAEAAA